MATGQPRFGRILIMILMVSGSIYIARQDIRSAPYAAPPDETAPYLPEPVSLNTPMEQTARGYKNSIGMEFLLIDAGEFDMGSPSTRDDEGPVHRVTISKPFYMGKYEVTQRQWRMIMMTDIKEQRDKKNPEWPLRGEGASYPMYYISWDEAQEFIRRLNDKEGADRYRLPTEAEWEYACRAGSTDDYAGSLDAMGWYQDNAGMSTHMVGRKRNNAWGLYDMHGNVWEWCQDWYGVYSSEPVTDPPGPDSGKERIIRGGGWSIDAAGARSSERALAEPITRNSSLGFRVVREVR